ncbi:MAG: response regulator [Planctomycetota bacterium]|jgi:CheY-like chemotaxis protein
MTDRRADEGAGISILVVDDEAMVRTTLGAMLEAGGYQVLEATNGDEALRLLDADSSGAPARPQLVITDMLMSGRDGSRTIVDLRSAHPEVRIIAISGGGSDLLNRARALGADHILPKPFMLETLLEAVQTALGEGA